MPAPRYQLHPVPRPLHRHVQTFWSLRLASGPVELHEHVVPDLTFDLVLQLGTPYQRGPASVGESWVEGLRDRPVRFVHRPGNVLVGARLWPWGLAGLGLTVRATECDGGGIPLRALTPHAQSLEASLANGSTEAAVAGLSDWLATRQRAFAHARLLRAGLRALDVPGARVDQVASTLGVSRRRLERAFDAGLGVSPGFARRLLRFRRAFEALRSGAQSDAGRVGYCDQSHLCREASRFGGMSPSELAKHPLQIVSQGSKPRVRT